MSVLFLQGRLLSFYKQLIHLNSSFPKVIPNLFKLFWEKLERGIYMASQTNVREMIAKNNAKKGGASDKIVPIILGIISAISILTTIAILFTLLTETITFFTRVPFSKFF